jgi:hypothetical protein
MNKVIAMFNILTIIRTVVSIVFRQLHFQYLTITFIANQYQQFQVVVFYVLNCSAYVIRILLTGTYFGDFVCLSIHNVDDCCFIGKEEGVEGIGVAKETKHVVVHVGRLSNLLDDFLFPIDQLQWFVIDTSYYLVIIGHQHTHYLLINIIAFVLIVSDCHLVVLLFYANEVNASESCNNKFISSICLPYILETTAFIMRMLLNNFKTWQFQYMHVALALQCHHLTVAVHTIQSIHTVR